MPAGATILCELIDLGNPAMEPGSKDCFLNWEYMYSGVRQIAIAQLASYFQSPSHI